MSNWIRIQPPTDSSGDFGPIQLAWLGDAVWELHHRLRQCRKPGRTSDLHLSVVAVVKAASQADALSKLELYLNSFEKDLVRRGRNKAGRGPRNVDAAIYGKATGFETMIGWLFLKDPPRLAELFDRLEQLELDSE